MTRFAWHALIGAILPLLAGCASVSITKITDAQQDKSADGLRFYRPRPYLVVHQPTPVGGADFMVSGQVDVNGHVVSIDPRSLPPVLQGYFPNDPVSGKALVPFDSITLSQEAVAAQDSGAGGDTQTESPTTPKANSPSNAPKSTKGQSSKKKPTTQASTQASDTGKSKASIKTTDGGPEPLEKLDDYFSIIYLPDFQENYVVKVSSGAFGVGSADVAMRYGWLVERAQWDSDNRAVGQFISETVQTAIKTAGAVINPASGISAAPQLAQLTQPGPHAEAVAAPVHVLLRVRYVLEAQPGVYPILKPGETVSTQTSGIAGASNPVLLPISPYTVVAYNYRRALSIEYANAANPSEKKQPKTGEITGSALDALRKWLKNENPKFTSENVVSASVDAHDVLTVVVKQGTFPNATEQNSAEQGLQNDLMAASGIGVVPDRYLSQIRLVQKPNAGGGQ